MSKILFVVTRPLEINTSASIRNKSMIEGLIQNGHTVDLVTAGPNVHHAAYDESLSVQGVNAIRIAMNNAQRLAGLGGNNKLFLKLKSLAYKWVTRHEVYDHLKSLANHTDSVNLADGQYDYIISSSDPKSSHLFVLKLLEQQGRNFKGKWIQIWGDPFFADITQTNRNKRIIKNEEQRLLQGADYVFYVSQMQLALRDYYRAFRQRASWVRNDLLYVNELGQYEQRLIDEWEHAFAAMEETLSETNNATEEEKAKEGRQLFSDIEKRDIRIRPKCQEAFIMRGSYHILANQLKIGWHVDFFDRLKQLLNT